MRAKDVEEYYGIKVHTIYTWFKREKESGNPAPIKISSPGSKDNKRSVVFVEHQSVIDYFKSGLNRPQS